MIHRAGLSLVIALLLLRVVTAGQLAHLWSFDELTAKSDVVVIATFVVTRDTGIKTNLAETQPPLPVVELHTEFTILSVLKADTSDRAALLRDGTVSLRHFRLDTDRILGGCINCGGHLDFSDSGARCRSGEVLAPMVYACAYELFLRRDGIGIFAPISGQVWPGDSVFTLRKPG
jgi:hypothetical protein